MTTADLYRTDKKSRLIARMALFFILAIFLSATCSAQQPTKAIDWGAYRFLLGEWFGEGGGDPGQGVGGFTFSLDLQNTILVRRNYADYPATKDRPAFSHNDLMVVYKEGENTRAIYFDNEQHIINYTVTISKDSNSVVFLSDVIASAPRFRLTNTKTGNDSMKITFEFAPPGKPEAFARYIEADARRKK
jgi:hypothetical protein